MNYIKRKFSPKTLIGGLFFNLIRHIYLLIKSSEYRKSSYYYSLSNRLPRYQPISIKLNNRELTAPDAASFASMYEEIYVDRIYETSQSIGRILDIGSNIGISVLWFKEFYPESEVVAYEADRDIFKYLESNTKNCKGVSIINEAVWHRDEILQFVPEGADAGRISDGKGKDISKKIIFFVLFSGIWKPHFYINFMHIHLELQNIIRDASLLLLTYLSIKYTKTEIRSANGFTWFPVLEVAKLFAGIFITIIPVIAILINYWLRLSSYGLKIFSRKR